eukprot:scaffold57373_cov19-Tisochrysis_lutea.AAC.2
MPLIFCAQLMHASKCNLQNPGLQAFKASSATCLSVLTEAPGSAAGSFHGIDFQAAKEQITGTDARLGCGNHCDLVAGQSDLARWQRRAPASGHKGSGHMGLIRGLVASCDSHGPNQGSGLGVVQLAQCVCT